MIVETVLAQVRANFSMNCYLLSTGLPEDGVVVVDPGASGSTIHKALGDRQPTAIILTHRHHDHIGALDAFISSFETAPVPIYLHELEKDAVLQTLQRMQFGDALAVIEQAMKTVVDGDTINAGKLDLQVIHTPGHTAGSICLYDENSKQLLSGDTIFYGTTGRTDLESGSPKQMHDSLQRLAELPDETFVYPGHDQTSTIAHERNYALIEY